LIDGIAWSRIPSLHRGTPALLTVRASFRARQAKEGAFAAQARRKNGNLQQYHSSKESCMKISMTVNGKPVSAEVETRTLLVTFIRENLRLTGTHVGCDTSQCGACTIHMNGQAVKSCNILAMQAEGADILTIEGLAKADGTLHPMQEAFREHHGLQCGFCTPGMVMSAVDLVKNHPNPSEETIRAELDGNLCRCTGYHNIVKAVMAASAKM
jgi:aerobic carbon-monoxide dehydrogenase small subunit